MTVYCYRQCRGTRAGTLLVALVVTLASLIGLSSSGHAGEELLNAEQIVKLEKRIKLLERRQEFESSKTPFQRPCLCDPLPEQKISSLEKSVERLESALASIQLKLYDAEREIDALKKTRR